MTSSDLRSHSEPLLKSLRLLKFSDIIHLEILSFVYQWYHKLSRLLVLLIILTQYLQFIQIIHANHRLIICLLNLFIPLNTAFVLSISYTGPKLWNSLSTDVKKIKPFSSFRQYIKNSVIDGYNTIIQKVEFDRPGERSPG